MILIHLVSGKIDYFRKYRLLGVNNFSVHPTLFMVGNYYNDYSWIWRYDTPESDWQGFRMSFAINYQTNVQVVGFMCALVGLLCIALPIPGFIAKFQMLYEYEVGFNSDPVDQTDMTVKSLLNLLNHREQELTF